MPPNEHYDVLCVSGSQMGHEIDMQKVPSIHLLSL